MTVECALRMARGARRVTECRRVVLVQDRPLVLTVASGDEVLVRDRIRERRFRHVLRFGEHDVLLDTRELVGDRFGKRHEGQVEEEDPVIGVVNDVYELRGVQTWVECVAYRTHTGNPVVELQVPIRVPGQRLDPVPSGDAVRLERLGESA